MSAEGSDRGRRAAGEGPHKMRQRERVLLPRRCALLMPPPPALLQYIRQAGFEHAVQLRDFCFDAALLSAFVERWRPETHTFHLP
ncbi:hypothetical protein PIB30_059275 [Stylosanthes scabra]|uniref:Aminotransferase-like plant mobile domain-containing protein n=1 Tax=Stylosanthes scabra TaxID=79078 RepID=A0ABU6QJU3_9FABA|nr:hypothetical protein [Stylosanthes scabra]